MDKELIKEKLLSISRKLEIDLENGEGKTEVFPMDRIFSKSDAESKLESILEERGFDFSTLKLKEMREMRDKVYDSTLWYILNSDIIVDYIDEKMTESANEILKERGLLK